MRIGDIALVLYAVMSHVGADYFTAKMHREQIAHWGIPEDEVLQTALVNTSFLYPPRLYSVEDMLAWDGKRRTDGRFMADGEAGKVRRGDARLHIDEYAGDKRGCCDILSGSGAAYCGNSGWGFLYCIYEHSRGSDT